MSWSLEFPASSAILLLYDIYCQIIILWLPGVPDSPLPGCREDEPPLPVLPATPPTVSSTPPGMRHHWVSQGLAPTAGGRGSFVPPASRLVEATACLGRGEAEGRQAESICSAGAHFLVGHCLATLHGSPCFAKVLGGLPTTLQLPVSVLCRQTPTPCQAQARAGCQCSTQHLHPMNLLHTLEHPI